MKAPAPAIVTRVAELTPAQRKIIDEYVAARERWKSWQAPVNPHSARYAELHALILSWFSDEKGHVALIAEGDRYTVPVSARENKRSLINVLKLVRKLGLKWMAENCKPTLTAVEKALSVEKRTEFITEERTGPRSLGEPAVKLAAAQAA